MQNAAVKKGLFVAFVLFVAGLLWWFLHARPAAVPVEAAGGDLGSVVSLDLESEGEVPIRGNAGSSSATGLAEGSPSSPNGAVSADGAAGVRALDAWHRALPGQWHPSPAEAPYASAIAAFAGIREGRAASYAARLRMGLPGVLGPDFDRYAAAFASGGTKALGDALSDPEASGPAFLAWEEAYGQRSLAADEGRSAGLALTRLVRGMLADGYPRERVLALAADAERVRGLAPRFLSAEEYTVQSGDSLARICARYAKNGHPLNFGWVAEFNGKRDPSRLRLGEELRIPLEPLSLEAWRSARIMALECEGVLLDLYPVSFGKAGHETPLGEFTLDDFEEDPVFWGSNPPLPAGHPENPLGKRWIGFKEDPSYGIHGNNEKDEGIGTFQSLGCLRMRNQQIEDLFTRLPRGGKILIHE